MDTAVAENEVQVTTEAVEATPKRNRNHYNIDNKVFVTAWAEVYKAGGNLEDVAKKLNMPKAIVSNRATNLKQKNIHLPSLARSLRKTNVDELNNLLSESGIDVEAVALEEAKKQQEKDS